MTSGLIHAPRYPRERSARLTGGGVRVLVGPPVFKTGEVEYLGLAGSIPVRLRQPSARDAAKEGLWTQLDPAPPDSAHRRAAGAAGRPRGPDPPGGARDPRPRPATPRSRRGAVTSPPTRSSRPCWPPSQPARRPRLRPVLNATGVVVHTNLGRAPLSAAAVEALCRRQRLRRRGTRPGHRHRARAGPPPGRPARRLSRRRGRAGGQQRRGRTGAGHHRAGRRPRGGGQPRRTDRDRRRLPAARPDRLDRRPAARGGHHQPDPPAATTPTPSAPTPAACSRSTRATSGSTDSPPLFRCDELRPLAAAHGVPLVADLGSGLLAPDPLPARRTGRRHRAGPAAPTSSSPAATNCSAGRRPACCSAARRSSPGWHATRWPARSAPTNSPSPRWRPRSRADRRRLSGRCTPTPERLRRRTERLAEALGVPVVAARRPGRRRRRPRSAAAGLGAPAPRSGSRGPLRTGDPAVLPRVHDGACLLDLRCVPEADDDRMLDAVRRRWQPSRLRMQAGRAEQCMSLPPPATSTTARAPWSARSPAWSRTAGRRNGAAG